ncbi:alpha-galactosidase [Promicromonospora umidemergens]|uniref:alpha-galactosidase n=1 Tax=Promicromonospora umidemergens TaxID=629679 RepID=A0ABP8WBX6_9MICO|nr:alpha-galactosidase [Promicromonospora umidemergens]MCP2284401.1 alpha-galactosidase [Promicromonospora umidemergens]
MNGLVEESSWSVLRRDGVAVVVAHPEVGLPLVLHWGQDLGELTPADLRALDSATSRQTAPGTLDSAWRPSLLPQESDGWAGRPGLLVVADGVPLFPRWTVAEAERDTAELVVTARDANLGLTLRTHLEIGVGGLVLLRHELTNDGPAAVDVHWLEATLPVPRSADHLTQFSGRWSREKVPVTTAMPAGSTARQTRRGRSGHDAPWVTLASSGTPRNRTGEVWATHLGWSADVTHRVDHLTEHTTLLGAGELVRPGEIRLAAGETYHAPDAYFAWSPAGLDGVADRFHTWVRARPQHVTSPRPLVLNTWEAVYFDHSPAKLERLARRAAAVGVERFVLDDGWFHSRRDDTTGLGDWVVDHDVWPDGLDPLAGLVHELGMQFGLWFEPEMVNLDSDLARAHPDWILSNPAAIPSPDGLSFRTQYVLDLANRDTWEYLRAQISALVTQLGIDFIKWDHNRDLAEPVHRGADGLLRPGTHAQTRATYALIARLKADHPGLEIESCSSGGARTDLGILEVTDRVWASDSNDPLERQDIQRWTSLVLPPELVGAHVGPSPAHSSGRTTDLTFRVATALQGHAGFEWDLLTCTDEELVAVSAYAALYKELRSLVHTGTVVHADTVDPALRVTGFVAPDRTAGMWTVATMASPQDALTERVRLDGLDPALRYSVRVRDEVGSAKWLGGITPAWLGKDAMDMPGSVLTGVGLQLPTLWPMQALIIQVTATEPK